MKYYIFMVNHAVETLAEDRQSFAFDTQTEALAKFHGLLSSAMAGTALNDIMVLMINSAMGVEKSERWERESAINE